MGNVGVIIIETQTISSSESFENENADEQLLNLLQNPVNSAPKMMELLKVFSEYNKTNGELEEEKEMGKVLSEIYSFLNKNNELKFELQKWKTRIKSLLMWRVNLPRNIQNRMKNIKWQLQH